MKKSSWFLAAFLTVTLGAGTAPAADYPTKPITLMTAFDAGGGSDVSHRLLEKFAKGVFDQPIVVTYKAGAGGEIGWTWLATRRNSSARCAASCTTPMWSWFPKPAPTRPSRISSPTPGPTPAR